MQINTYSQVYSTAQNNSTSVKQTVAEPQEIVSSGTDDTVSISLEARQYLAHENLTYSPTQSVITQLRYGNSNTYEDMSLLEKANQAILDSRIGLDREKIEDINQKMEDIIDSPNMSNEEKSQLLSQLEQEKEVEYEKVTERVKEQAKSELINKETDK